MGTLGQYLRSAREARGIDLRDAAQQTRISINYLKALEEEDFARLPGEVFVKGFLKNYGKFLRLDETEVMKRYGELMPQRQGVGPAVKTESAPAADEQKQSQGTPIEPFVWGAGILVICILLLFTDMPDRHSLGSHKEMAPSSSGQIVSMPGSTMTMQPEKLYLEVVALDSTWLLVRTDSSPQKKALLKKGDSLIWSADERFLLSYGSAGALKLLLNGQELMVNESSNTVVRDLVITASGIMNRKIQPENKPVRQKRPSTEQPLQLQTQGSTTQRQPVRQLQQFQPENRPLPKKRQSAEQPQQLRTQESLTQRQPVVRPRQFQPEHRPVLKKNPSDEQQQPKQEQPAKRQSEEVPQPPLEPVPSPAAPEVPQQPTPSP